MTETVSGEIIDAHFSEMRRECTALIFAVDGARERLMRELEGLQNAAMNGTTFSTNGTDQARIAYQLALREFGVYVYDHQDLLK